MARLLVIVLLLAVFSYSCNAWSTKFPVCSTFADCDPKTNEYLAREGTGRGGFFCARTCFTASDDCWLNSVNDPDICQQCLPITSEGFGFCQPCCRCWDPRVDLSVADTNAALSCMDVCQGQNTKQLPLEWDSCSILMGEGGRAAQAAWTASLTVVLVGAAIVIRL